MTQDIIILRDKLRVRARELQYTLRSDYGNRFTRSNERIHRELSTIVGIGKELTKIINKGDRL